MPLASSAEVSTETEATPGSLHWHLDGDGRAFLSVGTLERNRAPVSDPLALHRAPQVEVSQPSYAVQMGDDVTISNGWFVLFDNREDVGEPITRTVTLKPAAGIELCAAAITNGRRSPATVKTAPGGGLEISCTSASPPPGNATYTDCAFTLDAVYALEGRESREDLTKGDYYFTDTVGATSLGDLRAWTLRRLENHRGDDWSLYRATSPAWFAGQPLVFDQFGRFATGISSGANPDDTLTLYAGGRAAMSIVAEEGTTNTAFRVIDYECTETQVTLWVTAIGTNCTVVTCSDLLVKPLVWTEEQDVSVDYAIVNKGGVDCYTITFPFTPANGGTGRFWRARTAIGISTAAAVRVDVPLILTSPDGTRWKLKIANDGSLSTEAAE